MVAPIRSGNGQDARPTLYLVFAGLHSDARRGTGDLVAVSPSRENAQAAFRSVRLRLADGEGWAELTAVSDDGTTRRLSWFGTDRWARPNPLVGLVQGEAAVTPQTRRWPRRAVRQG